MSGREGKTSVRETQTPAKHGVPEAVQGRSAPPLIQSVGRATSDGMPHHEDLEIREIVSRDLGKLELWGAVWGVCEGEVSESA